MMSAHAIDLLLKRATWAASPEGIAVQRNDEGQYRVSAFLSPNSVPERKSSRWHGSFYDALEEFVLCAEEIIRAQVC